MIKIECNKVSEKLLEKLANIKSIKYKKIKLKPMKNKKHRKELK